MKAFSTWASFAMMLTLATGCDLNLDALNLDRTGQASTNSDQAANDAGDATDAGDETDAGTVQDDACERIEELAQNAQTEEELDALHEAIEACEDAIVEPVPEPIPGDVDPCEDPIAFAYAVCEDEFVVCPEPGEGEPEPIFDDGTHGDAGYDDDGTESDAGDDDGAYDDGAYDDDGYHGDDAPYPGDPVQDCVEAVLEEVDAFCGEPVPEPIPGDVCEDPYAAAEEICGDGQIVEPVEPCPVGEDGGPIDEECGTEEPAWADTYPADCVEEVAQSIIDDCLGGEPVPEPIPGDICEDPYSAAIEECGGTFDPCFEGDDGEVYCHEGPVDEADPACVEEVAQAILEDCFGSEPEPVSPWDIVDAECDPILYALEDESLTAEDREAVFAHYEECVDGVLASIEEPSPEEQIWVCEEILAGAHEDLTDAQLDALLAGYEACVDSLLGGEPDATDPVTVDPENPDESCVITIVIDDEGIDEEAVSDIAAQNPECEIVFVSEGDDGAEPSDV